MCWRWLHKQDCSKVASAGCTALTRVAPVCTQERGCPAAHRSQPSRRWRVNSSRPRSGGTSLSMKHVLEAASGSRSCGTKRPPAGWMCWRQRAQFPSQGAWGREWLESARICILSSGSLMVKGC